MPFTFHSTPIDGLVLVEGRIFGDERGYFRETAKASDFATAGLPSTFVQDNTSRSKRDVVRGLHFQSSPRGQGKLVTVTSGTVFDVAVDLRKGSPTYGTWHGVELTESNGYSLWIPVGFAHGFSVLSDWADLVYKCTDEYSAAHDAGIAWNDPDVAVDWKVANPIISAKDAELLPLAQTEPGFSLLEVLVLDPL
jgi:dTDP-4-dehydrorhamnose 3,5-epimerase